MRSTGFSIHLHNLQITTWRGTNKLHKSTFETCTTPRPPSIYEYIELILQRCFHPELGLLAPYYDAMKIYDSCKL